MLIGAILCASLFTLAAAGPLADQPDNARLSRAEKAAAAQRVIHSATDCVAREVRVANPTEDLAQRIVAAMPACAETMRMMIQRFDDAYGEGSGEVFFSGSFLDHLPMAVMKRLSDVGE